MTGPPDDGDFWIFQKSRKTGGDPKLGLTFSNLSEILLSLSKAIFRIIRNSDGTPAGQEDIDRR